MWRAPARSTTSWSRSTASLPSPMPSATLLASAGAADDDAGALELAADPGVFAIEQIAARELQWNDVVAWEAERDRALSSAGRRLTVSATRLAEDLAWNDPGAATDEGLRKDAVDLELPPWQRG